MLNKQGIDVSFAEGLDTKTDPKRVAVGKFLKLENTVFNKGGMLQKRNGYAQLTSLPDTSYSYLTTFNGNLTAVGSNIAAYNSPSETWVQKGALQPMSVATLPVIRNNLNQSSGDIAIASNGLACSAYLENDGATTKARFVVFDSVTGQNIKAPADIPVSTGTVTGGMRVFVLGNNFIIVFTNVITAVSHLQYIAVSVADPTSVSVEVDIAVGYTSATTLAWDGYISSNKLYIAYNTASGGQSVKVTYLTSGLSLTTPVSFATYKATMMSVTSDESVPSSPTIYVSFYRADTSVGYTLAVDQVLNTVMSPQQIISSGTILNLTSVAASGVCTVIYETSNSYSFAPGTGTATNYISKKTVTLATTTVSSATILVRSVGLASKAFSISGVIYVAAAYSSSYQPTYFVINASQSTSAAPVIAGKLAYGNGGGYLTTGLPGVVIEGSTARFLYLYKDLIQAANKGTALPTGTQTAGIYSQTGINLASIIFGTDGLDTAEIGKDLHLSGGFLWMYDGYLPVEHNFFLWPDVAPTTPPSTINTAVAAWSDTGGTMHAKPDGSTNTNAYFYQFVYEWTDNQGNAFRSSPSIPISVTSTGNGTTGSVALKIPTLRLTMKTANPVKIVIYRWSVGQQEYYQTTSITTPLLNDTTVDSVSYLDTLEDSTILGNNLIYTTGGVVEDVNAPATNLITLFDSRLWLVSAEDPNLLWYSKQVIEATPVEMSDLFTIYVPPTTSTQGDTGPIRSIAPMDDKIIIGKQNALLYINGSGPDNTGKNSQYSEPIFITSTVGCTNQKSIVLMPKGLMFQSDKGIWLLGRGLETEYIGAPVEDFTQGATVLSAVNVPETNQVRFTLDTGITLMYDYFYGQWSTFKGVSAISSCIFQTSHTFINSSGAVYQESPGTYLDGSSPVLMSFKTGPLRIGALQNYQRAYFFYFLGTYLSPHKIQVLLTYDYATAPTQSVIITPTNFSPAFGSPGPFGQGNPYGGPGNLEAWRVFLENQRCMAFGIEVQEIFDPTMGVAPGAGFTLSGLNVVCAFKKQFRPQQAANSAG